MRVSSLKMTHFRAFRESPTLEFGAINVLVGANNAGKSSVLKALALMQEGLNHVANDIRLPHTQARIEIGLTGVIGIAPWSAAANIDHGTLAVELTTNEQRGSLTRNFTMQSSAGNANVSALPGAAPHHFIVPFFAKRKTAGYVEEVRLSSAMAINPSMQNLAAKLSRISNPSFPKFKLYEAACLEMLGFVVTAIPSTNGHQPGIHLPDDQSLNIDQMGEGVPNIVGMLADLAMSKNKLFLVEEPENDLHPKALKALLELMIASARDNGNQFVVSTHSNIVLRYLGATEDSRVFRVSPKPDMLPAEGEIAPVEPTAEARMQVLRELGYTPGDFELWDAWLFLEESSAERIIRDYLVRWFVPAMSRVRILAANGADDVEPTFQDFHRMIRFTHLEPTYRNAAWVLVDGDEKGKGIVQRLKDSYSTWDSDRFRVLSHAAFERYYPSEFADDVERVLQIANKRDRRQQKKELLLRVMAWLDADATRGRLALEESAAEVIGALQDIANWLIERDRRSGR